MHWMASLKWLDCVLFSNFWHCIVSLHRSRSMYAHSWGSISRSFVFRVPEYIYSSPWASISPNGNMTP